VGILLKRIFITISTLILIIAVYLYVTYIDETIFTGSGYEFSIGTTKGATFENVKEIFKNKSLYIIFPEDSYGAGPFKEINYNSDYLVFKEKNSWKFYYSNDAWDSIELTFENNKLLSIYRRRQRFELP